MKLRIWLARIGLGLAGIVVALVVAEVIFRHRDDGLARGWDVDRRPRGGALAGAGVAARAVRSGGPQARTRRDRLNGPIPDH